MNWINPTSRIWPFRNKCGVSRWWLPFIETLCTLRAAAGQLAQSTITPRRKTSSWCNFFDWKTFSRASLLTERLTNHFETKSETWKQCVRRVHFRPFLASSSSGWKLTGNSSRLLLLITSSVVDFNKAAVCGRDFCPMLARFLKAS